nr:hypothetical protein [Pandoravirus belohorizontensis]
MPPLARARAPPPSTRAAAIASVALCDLTSDGPVGSPDHYHEVIAALSTKHATTPRCVPAVADPLAVRPAIAKPRPMPGRAAARRMAAATTPSDDSHTRRAQQPQKKTHSAPPALVALYMEGARAVASWPLAAASACAPRGDDFCDPCACGPACETAAGGIDCDALDAADIEGSLRLRLASLEEAFEYQAARRLVAALDRLVARGAVHAVALHRPLWSRPACLACTAMSAPPRPSPVRVAQRHVGSSSATPSPTSTPYVLDTTDVATSLSSFGAATVATKQMGATPLATLDGLCVYTATRAPDGSVAWTARRRSDATDKGLGTTTSTVSAPSTRPFGGCARCAVGACARGVVPTAPSTGAVVTVDAGEVVGAVAANLWEGVAGTVISINAEPDRRYRTLWSGVPGKGLETVGLLDATAVPSTTWLATETRALVIGGAPRRPANGSDALYACARIAYATARLEDTTARQRTAHTGASSDPRRVRPATPLTYAPSIDSTLAALAWMRGAASVFGAAVDADRALCDAVMSYRMHVLARDLERTPLAAPFDPAQLPDEVRDLARQLQASLCSIDQGPSGDDAQAHPAAPWPVFPYK